MQSREFLALADQLQAFQTIMSGALKKETAEAKQALADLKAANDLLQVQGKMDQDKVEFEEYRMRIQDGLDGLKQDLVEQAAEVSKQAAELAAKEVKLEALVTASKEAVASKEKTVAELEKQAEAAEAKQTKALTELEKHTQAMLKREEKVTLREQEVEKKLSIIKSLG
jgi:hypothetical protein